MGNTRKAIVSAIYLVSNALLQKLIGLISTLILARVLVPEDFAIVAIALLVVNLTEVFGQTGSAQYIMSRQEISDDTLNSAWTLDLLIKLSITLVINLCAWPVSQYYSEPELRLIIHTLSVIPFISSLNNPGLWVLQREQNYKRYVKAEIIAKVISVIVTISIALTTKSYWALIFGQISSALLVVMISYQVHTFRPQMRTTEISQQWRFSGFMIPQELFGYVKANIDSFMVSKHYNSHVFGSFHVMKYLSVIPSLNFIVPMSTPLLVEMSKELEDREQSVFKYTLAFSSVLLVAAPISIFFYQNSFQLVSILLGNNWLEYHLVLGYMGMLVTSFFAANHCKRILMVLSKTKYVFVYEFLTLFIVLGTVASNLNNDIATLVRDRVYAEIITASLFLICTTSLYLRRATFYFIYRQVPIMIVCLVTLVICQYANVYIDDAIKHTLANGLVRGIVFGLVYIVSIGIMFLAHYKNTREGQHLLTFIPLKN